ncbi:MAG: hypothetical protein ACOY40_14315 [Bacillota bacterium]
MAKYNFVFLVLRLFTADPAAMMLGQYTTAEQVAALRERPWSPRVER